MLKIHQKIIKEIVDEKSKDPKVAGILLYGSLARGTANENSDVDIEIVYEGNEHKETEEKRHEVEIDFEYWPKNRLEKRIEKYPFLSYPYLEEKILYDRMGFLKKIKLKLKKYFKENPNALKEWQKWEKEYLQFKRKNIKRTNKEKIRSCKEFYDELEIKFSKEHKVSRDF